MASLFHFLCIADDILTTMLEYAEADSLADIRTTNRLMLKKAMQERLWMLLLREKFPSTHALVQDLDKSAFKAFVQRSRADRVHLTVPRFRLPSMWQVAHRLLPSP